jgi:hypothetical protein
MKLIDKEAVLEEIEKLTPPFSPSLAEKMSYQDATKDCIDIIYTLKVKEIGVDVGSPEGDIGVKTIWDGDKIVSNKVQKGE